MSDVVLDGAEEVAELLRNHAAELGYVQIDRDTAPPGRIGRFDWSVDKARERGFLEGGADEDDLPDACMRWIESSIAADVSDTGGSYRVRLARPKGEWIKQKMVRAHPDEVAELPDVEELVPAPVDPMREAVTAYQEMLREQRAFYRAIIVDYGALARLAMRGAVDGAENVRLLFDAHVRRETSLIDRERQRVEEARRAAESRPDSTMMDGIADIVTRLWAVHNDLPPDLIDLVNKDSELRDLLADPRTMEKLRDPDLKAALRTIITGGAA